MWQINNWWKRIFYFCCSVLLCSFILGGKASVILSHAADSQGQITGTVDAIAPEYEVGHRLYLENCATCHVGIPPAVLPTQSWSQILRNPQHYSTKLKPLARPGNVLVANYLRQYSRSAIGQELIPTRLRDSRYFKALHPQVKFTEPIDAGSCLSCHSQASEFNFRTYTDKPAS